MFNHICCQVMRTGVHMGDCSCVTAVVIAGKLTWLSRNKPWLGCSGWLRYPGCVAVLRISCSTVVCCALAACSSAALVAWRAWKRCCCCWNADSICCCWNWRRCEPLNCSSSRAFCCFHPSKSSSSPPLLLSCCSGAERACRGLRCLTGWGTV